jgi:hypothetical protein
VAEAIRLGARQADQQPRPRRWRVMLDPAGHPFCLCDWSQPLPASRGAVLHSVATVSLDSAGAVSLSSAATAT